MSQQHQRAPDVQVALSFFNERGSALARSSCRLSRSRVWLGSPGVFAQLRKSGWPQRCVSLRRRGEPRIPERAHSPTVRHARTRGGWLRPPTYSTGEVTDFARSGSNSHVNSAGKSIAKKRLRVTFNTKDELWRRMGPSASITPNSPRRPVSQSQVQECEYFRRNRDA